MSVELRDGGICLPNPPLSGVSAVKPGNGKEFIPVVPGSHLSSVSGAFCVLRDDVSLLSKSLDELSKKIDPSLCKGEGVSGFSKSVRDNYNSTIVNAIFEQSDRVRQCYSLVTDMLARCQL